MRMPSIAVGPFFLAVPFPRGDGRGPWVGKYRHKDEKAWRQHSMAGALDQADAAQKLATFVRALAAAAEPADDGGPDGTAFRTFGAFVEKHHLRLLREQKSRSFEQYALRWRLYGARDLGLLTWDQIRQPIRIQAWILGLQTRMCAIPPLRPLSARWVRGVYQMVSGALTHAVALGYLPSHPGAPVARWLPPDGPAPVSAGKRRAFRLGELETLVEASHVSAARRIEYLCAALGMLRPGETRGLRWRCVHLGRVTPYFRIERSYDGPVKATGRKTPPRPRDMPIHPDLEKALRWWHRVGFAAHVGRAPTPDDPVFPQPDGSMRKPSDSTAVRRAIARAGLPRMSMHGFRHTGATAYKLAGLDSLLVAAMMGHKIGGILEHEGGEPIEYAIGSSALAMTAHYARWTVAYAAEQISRVRIAPAALAALMAAQS